MPDLIPETWGRCNGQQYDRVREDFQVTAQDREISAARYAQRRFPDKLEPGETNQEEGVSQGLAEETDLAEATQGSERETDREAGDSQDLAW